jgi:hypothetical protein
VNVQPYSTLLFTPLTCFCTALLLFMYSLTPRFCTILFPVFVQPYSCFCTDLLLFMYSLTPGFVQPYSCLCTALLLVFVQSYFLFLYSLTSCFCTAILPDDGPVRPEKCGHFKNIIYVFFVGLICNNCMIVHGMKTKKKPSTRFPRMCNYCGHYTGSDDVVAIVLWLPLVHKTDINTQNPLQKTTYFV